MNINFPPVDDRFIKSIVENGYYSNVTEAVRDAVRRMRRSYKDEQDKHERLMAALEEGMADVRAGRTVPYTPELMQQILEDGLRDAANGVKPDPDVCP